MTSEVDICNLALSNIRSHGINSLNENSLQAQQCKLKYPFVRDRMLTEAVWNFSRSIETLALLSEVDIFNWTYAYQYPTDILRINRLVGEQEELDGDESSFISSLIDSQVLPVGSLRSKIPYEVFNFSGNKVIGANMADLRIDYIMKVTDPNKFPPDFVMALSHLLAAELAVPIVGVKDGRSLRSDSFTLYKDYMASAVANDMNENHMEVEESEFISERR